MINFYVRAAIVVAIVCVQQLRIAIAILTFVVASVRLGSSFPRRCRHPTPSRVAGGRRTERSTGRPLFERLGRVARVKRRVAGIVAAVLLWFPDPARPARFPRSAVVAPTVKQSSIILAVRHHRSQRRRAVLLFTHAYALSDQRLCT